MASIEKDRPWRHRGSTAVILLFLLAILFNWPYLTGDFFADDLIFLNLMADDSTQYSWWRGVWSVNDYPFMDNIWWKEFPSAGKSGIFWRPLPSLVIEASLYIFGRNAFPLHLLSILLHGAVAALLYALVRKLSGQGGLAFLAGLFFVACEDLSMVIGWIATITDPLCVLFIMLALLAHVHWLKRRRPVALVGSIAALVLAMTCKETAAVAPLAVVLLSFFMPVGSDGEGFRWSGFRQQMVRTIRDPLSWLPAGLVLAAYLTMYRLLDAGTMDSLMYVSPLANPVGYLGNVVRGFPVMWLGSFSPVPPSIPLFWPETSTSLAGLGLVIFVAFLAALWPLRHRSLVLWSLVLYLVALLPQLSTDASERGLYFPTVAAAIILAFIAQAIGPLVRRLALPLPAMPRWTRTMGWVAVVWVLVPGILFSAVVPWSYLASFSKPQKELSTVLPHIEERRPEHVMLLNTSSLMLTVYTWDVINHLSDEPQDVWTLSSGNGVYSLERVGDSSFVIRSDRSGWLDNFFARLLRTKPTLEPGRSYRTPLFTATLLELTKSRRDALAVRFDFKQPLDETAYLFLRWNGEAFEPVNIAGLQIGESIELADTSDLWKMMY